MSSYKQKMIENKRYPHVKRGWIKAIKAIRNGGGIQKRIYLVEHPQGLDASQKRQRIAQDTGGYINHPDPGHWTGVLSEAQTQDMSSQRVGSKRHLNSYQKDIWRATTNNLETKQRDMEARGNRGFQTAPLLTA